MFKIKFKPLFLLLFPLFSCLAFSQQNEEFKSVKQHFDYQRYLLAKEFRTKINESSQFEKEALVKQFEVFMKKLDSVQNRAYITTLVKVKTLEELKQMKIESPVFPEKETEIKNEEPATYPGGINALRTQVAELFYSNVDFEGTLKAQITFVVERDGQISTVEAEGENAIFNRQAMISVYLLPEKFSPAYINGMPVRYRFRLPLSMKIN